MFASRLSASRAHVGNGGTRARLVPVVLGVPPMMMMMMIGCSSSLRIAEHTTERRHFHKSSSLGYGSKLHKTQHKEFTEKQAKVMTDALRVHSWHLRQQQKPPEEQPSPAEPQISEKQDPSSRSTSSESTPAASIPLSKNQQFRRLPILRSIMKMIIDVGAGKVRNRNELLKIQRKHAKQQDKNEKHRRGKGAESDDDAAADEDVDPSDESEEVERPGKTTRNSRAHQKNQKEDDNNDNDNDDKEEVVTPFFAARAGKPAIIDPPPDPLGIPHELKMNMVFRNRFRKVASATSESDIPSPGLSEVAFAGRSNVGKSSLINAITNKFLVKTSDRPGETQSIDFYRLGKCLKLVDLPGYGFAFADEKKQQNWRKLMDSYLTSRSCLKRVYVLIDSRHGIKANDSEFIDSLDSHGVSYQIVMTKADLVQRKDLARRIYLVQKELKTKQCPHAKDILLVSSKRKTGIDEMRDEMLDHADFSALEDKIERQKARLRTYFL